MSDNDNDPKKSPLDTLDLARGEVNDEDVLDLEQAINNLDFATRKASDGHMSRLEALRDRLADVIEQIKQGERREETRPEPDEEQLERYQALVDEGVAAGERGDLDTAETKLEEAVRTHPDGVAGLFNLGVVYGLLAHHNITKAEFYDDYVRDEVYVEKAQLCYDHVLDLQPNHLPSLNNLATLCAMRDNREGAVIYLKRIVESNAETDSERNIVREAEQQLRELETI